MEHRLPDAVAHAVMRAANGKVEDASAGGGQIVPSFSHYQVLARAAIEAMRVYFINRADQLDAQGDWVSAENIRDFVKTELIAPL